jgi:hypothetical protein
MSRDAVNTVVLSEDTQTECFIRRFLVKQGWDTRKIYPVPVPNGRGSGSGWVLNRFTTELKAYRSRCTRVATCLIVAADADNKTVEERVQTFKDACAEAGLPFRKEGERVIFVIPRRNIETWLAYLRGEAVNELDAYRKYDYESDCREQVVKLADCCGRKNLEPAPPPPSLVATCAEFKRIAG